MPSAAGCSQGAAFRWSARRSAPVEGDDLVFLSKKHGTPTTLILAMMISTITRNTNKNTREFELKADLIVDWVSGRCSRVFELLSNINNIVI